MTATPERIQDIAHLGSVELLTPKLDRSLWYFKDVLGMEVVHVDGQSVYLRGYGDHAASALKLTAAARPGVGCISWRAIGPAALERRVKAIEANGREGTFSEVRVIGAVITAPKLLEPASGAKVVLEPRREPWGKTARYLDPDGNIVSITES